MAGSARPGLGIRQPVHNLREIVNAILYVTRTGIAWEYLPHDFPPAKTVYDYYAKWEKDGTTQQIHDLLRHRLREAEGRDGSPSAAAIDAWVCCWPLWSRPHQCRTLPPAKTCLMS